MALARSLLAKNIQAAREVSTPLPLMMGEFGVSSLSKVDQARFYHSMYAELRAADIGSFFWDLSVSEHTFGVLYANGSRTPAAEAIAAELGDQYRSTASTEA
jgi:hypothetical protein